MARYVIAVNRTIDNMQPFAYEVFKVSNDLQPDDVTVSFNTVFFQFAFAEVNNLDELKASLMTIQIGNKVTLTSNSVELNYENPFKRYWIGKEVSYEGIDYVFNKYTNVLVPFACLSDDDEIIDM